jgi:hypothetical protein
MAASSEWGPVGDFSKPVGDVTDSIEGNATLVESSVKENDLA